MTFWTTGEADTEIALLDGEGADLSATDASPAPGSSSGGPLLAAATATPAPKQDGPAPPEGAVSVTTDLDEVFARVSGRQDGSIGRYALHNTYGADDHPGTLEEALVVAAGATVEASIDSPDDFDYFKVELTGPGSLTVWTTGEADTDITLYAAPREGRDPRTTLQRELLSAPEGAKRVATTDYSPPEPHTDLDEVFIQVHGRGLDEGSTGRYTLHNTFAAAPPSCGECLPKMVTVPAGNFLMRGDLYMGRISGPQMTGVQIARPFQVGVYEVTYQEWDPCVADGGCGGYRAGVDDLSQYLRPSLRLARGRHPVAGVSWNDAKAYVRWLSGKTGQEYRLLSEAEWEYVARAMATATPLDRLTPEGRTRYSWGDEIGSNRANCRDCGDPYEESAPVGSFPANPFGVYDMHGNVDEWVEDCWDDNPIRLNVGDPPDGSAPWLSGDCSRRVTRDGSWGADGISMRSSSRYYFSVGDRSRLLGFRVARTLN